MSLFLEQALSSKQPLLDITFREVLRSKQSWYGTNATADIIFERFQVDQEQDFVAIIFPDGYSTISIEFDLNGHTSPCYFGRMRQAKTVLYNKKKEYFVVKIPPHYLFPSKLPAKDLANRVSRLETFTDAFEMFPWEKFTQLTFEQQIQLFQKYVRVHLRYDQHELITYVLTEALATETPPLIKDLAIELDVSERYIRRLFSDLVGSSPKQVIQAVRLQQALEHILDQSKNMTDVFLDTHFYDQPHFDKFFKNQTTYSPTEFKELIQS